MNLDVEQIKKWMIYTNEQIQQNKQYLTELDQAIGDGDHGVNMARGFHEVTLKMNETNYDDVSELMKDVAMTIMSKVGGAAGPLYGTALLRLSKAWKEEQSIDHPTLANGFREAVEGIQQRGRARPGEKTLVDVWAAVFEYIENNPQIKTEALRGVLRDAV